MQNTRRIRFTGFLLWLLAIGYWLCPVAAEAGTFAVQWQFRDSISNVLAVKEVWLEPIAAYGVDGSTVIISGDRLTKRSDAAGSLIVSNLFNGRSYRVELTGPWIHTKFTNSFSTNVTGLVNGADPTYLVAPTRDTSTIAFSQAASDLRYLGTNVDRYVLSGTNVIFQTNSFGQLTINATASGSGSGGASWDTNTLILEITDTVTSTWDTITLIATFSF